MQEQDRPQWGDARLDKYTVAHALHYLKKHQPRFLFISLNDADEWAHQGNYSKYIKTLRQYDEWIENLFKTLDGMGDYGKSTTVLITTDHGRGSGQSWKHHSFFHSDSKYVWLAGRNPQVPKSPLPSDAKYTHIDIRPTIEAIVGLKPLQGSNRGRVISELAPTF
jgi:arylsulfatase A-like enzyme